MEHEISPFALAATIGTILSSVWMCAYLLSWIWAWAWAWVDDAKTPERSPLIDATMRFFGYEIDGERSWYRAYIKNGRGTDGSFGFFAPNFILFFAPLIMVASFLYYPVTIGAFCLYLTARLGRFARRQKLFDKHIKDPEAHK